MTSKFHWELKPTRHAATDGDHKRLAMSQQARDRTATNVTPSNNAARSSNPAPSFGEQSKFAHANDRIHNILDTSSNRLALPFTLS